jgi:hypothetical protein
MEARGHLSAAAWTRAFLAWLRLNRAGQAADRLLFGSGGRVFMSWRRPGIARGGLGRLPRCDSNAYIHGVAHSHTHDNRDCNADVDAFADS